MNYRVEVMGWYDVVMSCECVNVCGMGWLGSLLQENSGETY